MNRALLRGLAALTLTCLLPRLGATVLTFSQSATFTVSAGVSGSNPAGTGAIWDYAPFDPTAGTLESVTFTAVVTATVWASDVNWYGQGFPPVYEPKLVTPYTALHVTAYPTSTMEGSLMDSDYSYGAPVLVEPFKAFSHTATHTITVGHTLSDPAAFLRYSDPTLSTALISIVGDGPGRYGSKGLMGTVATTLTYTYRIDDSGATIAMFAACLAIAVGVRHRRKTSF